MSTRYYVSGPDRATRVQELFGRIASRYDLINDLQSLGLHRLWKRDLIRACRFQATESALDVCCGTGDIAIALARTGGMVTGCDFSPQMLAQARAREGAKVKWIQADALRLPFRDESFHVVTIAYGLRNVAHFEQGISELLRVLKPGGRLLILDFGKPRNFLWRMAYFAYLRLVVPLFGLLFCQDSQAYSYILESLRRYPAQDGVTLLLQQSGCRELQVKEFAGGTMSLHTAQKE